MVAEGAVPDHAAFNALVDALCKDGRWVSALRVVERMVDANQVGDGTGGGGNYRSSVVSLVSLGTETIK
eukprot:311475-Pyramimonas_sp.AAC.1